MVTRGYGRVVNVATGVATGGTSGGNDDLNNAAVRTRIGEHARAGKRILLGAAGGPGHYIYLVEMLADGLIAHDPAGCRCQGGTRSSSTPARARPEWCRPG